MYNVFGDHNRYRFFNSSKFSILSLFILFILNYIWFYKLGFHTLMGDDLIRWRELSTSTSFLDSTLLNSGANKYRPVLNVVQYFLNKSFSTSHELYFLVYILFNFLIIYFLHKVVLLITNHNRILAFVVCIFYLTSRFAYYNILQVFGIMEALCLFFLVLILYSMINLYRKNDLKYGVYLLALFFMIIFTHERYIVMLPFILLTYWLNSALQLKIKRWFLLFSMIPIFLNFFLKLFVFKTNALEGTGGTAIDFNSLRIVKFFAVSVANLSGINLGPEYLNGASFFVAEIYIRLFSLIIFIMIGMIFLIHLIKLQKLPVNEKLNEYKFTILFVVLLICLVSATSITIRVELRWLYAPFVVLLILLANITRVFIIQKMNKVAGVLILIFLTCINFNNDLYYRKNISSTYFIHAQQISDSAYNETIKKYGTNFAHYSVFIEKHTELNWPLSGTIFFEQYIRNTGNIHFVDDLKKVDLAKLEKSNTLAYRYNPRSNSLENVTSELYYNMKSESYTNVPVKYDFIKQFDKGVIYPKSVKVDTPTGKGALLLPWDNGFERATGLTILGGFQYSYPKIKVEKNDKLIFSLYFPNVNSDGARIFININNGSNTTRIIQKDIQPQSEIEAFEVNLDQFANSWCGVTFGVESPSGDMSGDWVVLQHLKLINK